MGCPTSQWARLLTLNRYNDDLRLETTRPVKMADIDSRRIPWHRCIVCADERHPTETTHKQRLSSVSSDPLMAINTSDRRLHGLSPLPWRRRRRANQWHRNQFVSSLFLGHQQLTFTRKEKKNMATNFFPSALLLSFSFRLFGELFLTKSQQLHYRYQGWHLGERETKTDSILLVLLLFRLLTKIIDHRANLWTCWCCPVLKNCHGRVCSSSAYIILLLSDVSIIKKEKQGKRKPKVGSDVVLLCTSSLMITRVGWSSSSFISLLI